MDSDAAIERFGMPRGEAVYAACASAFVVVLVLTNIIGVKLFQLPWFGGERITLTSGIVTYPITFLLTDVVSEIWGRRRANYMVVLGFLMSLLMLVVVKIARLLPASPFWTIPALGIDDANRMQGAFEATFHYPDLLLFASMLAYLVAQLFDVRLYHFWRRVTKGRHLWLRNNGSTGISQLVDTIIVNGIFLHFGMRLEWGTVWTIILNVYVCKLVLALIDTPFIYLACSLVRRYLGLGGSAGSEHAPLGGD